MPALDSWFKRIMRFAYWRIVWTKNILRAAARYILNHLSASFRFIKNYSFAVLRLIRLGFVELKYKLKRILNKGGEKDYSKNISLEEFDYLSFRAGIKDFRNQLKQFIQRKRIESKFSDEYLSLQISNRWKAIPLLSNESSALPKTIDATLIFHVFYLDIGLEMINRIIDKNLKFQTVIVTYSNPAFKEVLESALESICVEPVILFQTDNYLRDVAPFILAIRKFQPTGNLLKLHTKKSPHLKRETAETWRNSLLDGLLPDTQSVKIINDHLSTYQQPALYCPRKWLSEKKHWGRNGRYVYQMCNELKIPYQKHAPFPMGTMFWCNEQMVNELSKLDFPPMSPQHSERGLMDGTWPHAFERLLGQIVLSNGIGITDEGVNMFVANEKRNGHES